MDDSAETPQPTGSNDVPPPPPVVGAGESPPELVPLKGIPFPGWLVAFTIVTGLALILGVSRIKHAFGEGISYERATKQLAAGNAGDALPALQRAADEYPDSIDVKILLADAATQMGDLEVADGALTKLEGKEVSETQKQSLDRIEASFSAKVDALSAEIDKLEKQSKEKKK
jgi:uncharacterized protein HemY